MSARHPLPTAPSNAFRRRSVLESAGERVGQGLAAPAARSWLRRVYHAALMLQTGGRGLRSTLPHGETIRVHPAHRFLSWNPAEYEAFRAAVGPGTVALDVGANVGSYALLLGTWVGPSGAVFAFEPAPAVFAGLTRHVALNRLDGVVHPVRAAVGDRDGTATLSLSATAGESRLAAPGGEGPTVDIVTIDTFCAHRGIDPRFIKIDVEGFELAALRGARETIRRGRGRLSLFVELHPSVWPLIGVSRADVLAEFRAQGLQIAPLRPSTDVWDVEGECVQLVHAGAAEGPGTE